MRIILILLQKEFRQIFRNRTLIGPLLFAPIVQLLILPLAANFEVKNILLSVVDHDHSSYSQKLVATVISSGYFRFTGYASAYDKAAKLLERDKTDLVLEIQHGFERELVREGEQKVFIAVNAINGIKATLGSSYLGTIINRFNNDIRLEWITPPRMNPIPSIEITSANWFNPLMNYRIFMVPGILAMLVTMIGGFMCAMNIVKEKEIGTIEQINVTPIKKWQFVMGKLIPFWVLGMTVFTIGLFIIARYVYGIIPAGNIGLLYAFLSLYLLAILGFGLLISTYSETQQQAMSVAFFFIMVFNLMSGLFTPIDSMPEWAKVIARLNPLSYFIDVMRMVVLKGSGFADVKNHFWAALAFAAVFNTWAVVNYRKTV